MIKAYCKRVLLFLPYVVCYFLALGLALLALVMYASEFLFEDNTDSVVSVACYVPDDEAYTQLGINLVKQPASSCPKDSLRRWERLMQCRSR